MKYIFILLCLSIISCNQNPNNLIPTQIDEFAINFIADIQKKDIDKCLNYVDANMQTDEVRTFITNVSNGISEIQLDSLGIINARYTTLIGETPLTNYIVEYEQELESGSIYFFFSILDKEGQLKITGFDARKMEIPLKQAHAFTLVGKPLINYVFLFLAIISVGFVLITLITAIRTPLNRKWLWIIGILFAFIKFKLDWTTSAFDFKLISFQLFGAGFSKSGLIAPWILSFSIPIVAIAFWVKKYKQEREEIEDDKMASILAKYKNEENETGA